MAYPDKSISAFSVHCFDNGPTDFLEKTAGQRGKVNQRKPELIQVISG